MRLLALVLVAFFACGWTTKTHNLTILINDYRQEWNAKELIEDPQLECAAKTHLKYIMGERKCSGTGKLGDTVSDRAKKCGYPWTIGREYLICQYLTEDSWFNTLPVYRNEYRSLRDHSYQKIGVAGDDLWWVVILAR